MVDHLRRESAPHAARFAGLPIRRLVAWLLDIVFVSFLVALAFGPRVLGAATLDSFLISAGSAIVGIVYFALFAASASTTPGLAIVGGSLEGPLRARLACSALFGAMLLPFGILLVVGEPMLDVFGSFGLEVIA